MGSKRRSHGLWRLLSHIDTTLTLKSDVAVSPVESEGDVGTAGELSEGDVEGDVGLENLGSLGNSPGLWVRRTGCSPLSAIACATANWVLGRECCATPWGLHHS